MKINTIDIKAFSEGVQTGDCLKIISKRPVTDDMEEILSEVEKGHVEYSNVKRKYAHIAEMESGEIFTWTDLYIWNKVKKRKYTKKSDLGEGGKDEEAQIQEPTPS